MPNCSRSPGPLQRAPGAKLGLAHRGASVLEQAGQPGAFQERRSRLAGDLGVQRDNRFRFLQRLGIGRVPSSIGQPLADPNNQLGQLDTLVAEFRFGSDLPVHLLRRFTGGGPRSAGHGHVLADIGQGPQNACFTHSKILGMARQERVKIANRRAVIAIFHELDGPVVTLIGQVLDDDRPQPEPQHHEQAERDHQAHDERRRYDTLTAGSTCAFVLQFAKPAL